MSRRSGAATSALRFYERLGLIRSTRTAGNQRRYARTELRRVAFIVAARRLGVSLEDISAALATLPPDRVARAADWARLSSHWRADLDTRIAKLERLRDRLTSCIGCGCLSLQRCKLFNAGDAVAAKGSGPRLLYPDALADD